VVEEGSFGSALADTSLTMAAVLGMGSAILRNCTARNDTEEEKEEWAKDKEWERI
jgi:hypothetical protein